MHEFSSEQLPIDNPYGWSEEDIPLGSGHDDIYDSGIYPDEEHGHLASGIDVDVTALDEAPDNMTPGNEGNADIPHEQSSQFERVVGDVREQLLAELPVTVIGNTDPLNPGNTEYPNVLFHGTRRNFDLDGSKDYRSAPQTTGARTGRGLYCAAEPVAALFGSEKVVAILPKKATVLDLTSPMVEQPLSSDFRQAFVALQEAKLEASSDDTTRDAIRYARDANRPPGLVSVQESADFAQTVIAEKEAANGMLDFAQKRSVRTAINEAFSRSNAQLIMVDPDTSIRTLFALHDSVNGTTKFAEQKPVYDVATSLDFIVGELGVDGAKTIQTFEPKVYEALADDDGDWVDDEPSGVQAEVANIDPSLWHGYVFWNLDKVGDHDSWEQRQEEQYHAPLTSLAARELAEQQTSVEHASVSELQQNWQLTAEETAPIVAALEQGEPLIDPATVNELISTLRAEQVDPYDVVASMATKSEYMATLLGANVGLVTENFRLHEHTQAVMGQFEECYASQMESGDRKLLRTALLLQDIGKSLATAVTGDKNNQTAYNAMVAANILEGVNEEFLSGNEKRLIIGLIGQDIIGNALQGSVTDGQAKEQFSDLVAKVAPGEGARVGQYAEIMYVCDTRAYTSAAHFIDAETGVQRRIRRPALNYLFLRPHGQVARLKSSLQQRIVTITAPSASGHRHLQPPAGQSPIWYG
jgi:hypothetical protein